MTTIEVVFPKAPEPLPPPTELSAPPTAVSDPEAVIMGRDFLWNIKSEDDRVKSVRIVFQPNVNFFPGRAPDNSQEQVFPKYEAGVSYHMIWGKAPHEVKSVPLAKGECVTCKYTIHGLDANGKDVVEPFDPNIIISDPHP